MKRPSDSTVGVISCLPMELSMLTSCIIPLQHKLKILRACVVRSWSD